MGIFQSPRRPPDVMRRDHSSIGLDWFNVRFAAGNEGMTDPDQQSPMVSFIQGPFIGFVWFVLGFVFMENRWGNRGKPLVDDEATR